MRFLALVLLIGCSSACSHGSRPTHIFLITADTLRADHLSYTGYPRETSPHIDRFRGVAISFAQAVSLIPKTGPAFTTLFTGRHPEEHGTRFNRVWVSPELPVLAELLDRAGYTTAAFVSNTVLRRDKGFGRGFGTYRMTPLEDPSVDRVNRMFREWADQHDWSKPTFCWIHYLDPHGPYTPAPRFERLFLDDEHAISNATVSYELPADPALRRKPLGAVPLYQQRPDGENRVARFVSRYDAEIRQMDEAFGSLIDDLRRRRLFDESAVIFTSDHGESLGEHDFYFEHGWFAYDATLRVPLLIKEPHRRSPAEVSAQVSHLDLLPTILGLAGLSPPPGGAGQDLVHGTPAGGPVVVENSDNYPEKYHGLRAPGWKFLVRQRDGAAELYDLETDPGETVNRAQADPERVENLRAVLERELSVLRARAVPPPPEGAPPDAATVRELQRLGYGGDED